MSFQKLEIIKAKPIDLVKMQMLKPVMNPMYGNPVFLVLKENLRDSEW